MIQLESLIQGGFSFGIAMEILIGPPERNIRLGIVWIKLSHGLIFWKRHIVVPGARVGLTQEDMGLHFVGVDPNAFLQDFLRVIPEPFLNALAPQQEKNIWASGR